jgi:hypothetical protein
MDECDFSVDKANLYVGGASPDIEEELNEAVKANTRGDVPAAIHALIEAIRKLS